MSLSKLARIRITRLVKIMEKVPQEHFNMRSWFSHIGDHPLKLAKGERVTKTTLKDCGTTACAAGWAATDRYFQKLGLSLHNARGLCVGVIDGQPIDGRDYRLWDLLGKVFDLDKYRADYLFAGGTRVATPREWIERAQYLLDNDGDVA